MTNARRAQAAVFDGIMFLLLVSLSCTFVFVFVSSYGQQEDQVMRSAYTSPLAKPPHAILS